MVYYNQRLGKDPNPKTNGGYIMKHTFIRINTGHYAFLFDGVLYAVVTKCTDNSWRYVDSTKIYYYPTLKTCKEHFKLINWLNGKKQPLTSLYV